jgi:hypothetical protein
MAPEITVSDLLRLLMTSKEWQQEDPEEWIAASGLSVPMLQTIGQAAMGAILDRRAEGMSFPESIYQELLTCLQLGWLIHKEFGEQKAL